MKKFFVVLLIVVFVSACGTSAYMGEWKSEVNGQPCTLQLNSNGSVNAYYFYYGDKVTKKGTWEKQSDGSLLLNGNNAASGKVTLEDEKLVFRGEGDNKLVFEK